MKKVKKLSLNKEKISSLTNSDMQSIKGGQRVDNNLAGTSASSTNHNFTCCWCTYGPPETATSCLAACSPDQTLD